MYSGVNINNHVLLLSHVMIYLKPTKLNILKNLWYDMTRNYLKYMKCMLYMCFMNGYEPSKLINFYIFVTSLDKRLVIEIVFCNIY